MDLIYTVKIVINWLKVKSAINAIKLLQAIRNSMEKSFVLIVLSVQAVIKQLLHPIASMIMVRLSATNVFLKMLINVLNVGNQSKLVNMLKLKGNIIIRIALNV